MHNRTSEGNTLVFKWLRPSFLCCLTLFILMGLILLKIYSKEPPIKETDVKQPDIASIIELPDIDHTVRKTSEKENTLEKSRLTDNATGLTQHNLDHLRASMQRNADRITIKKNAEGSNVAYLNGTFKSVSAARRLPDGTLVVHCFDDYDAFEEFMTSPSIKAE